MFRRLLTPLALLVLSAFAPALAVAERPIGVVLCAVEVDPPDPPNLVSNFFGREVDPFDTVGEAVRDCVAVKRGRLLDIVFR